MPPQPVGTPPAGTALFSPAPPQVPSPPAPRRVFPPVILTLPPTYPPAYPPNYPPISKPANYVCLLAGQEVGIVNASGSLNSATAACNHRFSPCQNDYESSGNNDGNFGRDGGCIAQLRSK